MGELNDYQTILLMAKGGLSLQGMESKLLALALNNLTASNIAMRAILVDFLSSVDRGATVNSRFVQRVKDALSLPSPF